MTGQEPVILSWTQAEQAHTCANNEPSGSACASIWRLSRHTSRNSARVISGGLNGGEVPLGLTLEVLVASILAVVTLVAFIVILIEALPVAIAAVGITAAVLLNMILMYQMYDAYYDYIYSGDLGAYSDTEDKALQLVALASCEVIVAQFVYALFVLPYVAGQSSGGNRYEKSNLSSLEHTENFKDSAIEHIFEGSVRNGKACGYHYECIENTAGRVVPGTEIQISDSGVYKAQEKGK